MSSLYINMTHLLTYLLFVLLVTQANSTERISVPHDIHPGYSIKHLHSTSRILNENDVTPHFAVLDDGCLISTSKLSHLMNQSVSLLIEQERDGEKIVQPLTIHVRNRKEMMKFSKKSYSGDIYENEPPNTAVENLGNLQLFNSVGNVTFSIAGSKDFDVYHEKDVLMIVSTKQLDREAKKVYFLQLNATDSEGCTASTSVRIIVKDVNDNPPVFTEKYYSYTIKQDFQIFSTVGIVKAVDADGDRPVYKFTSNSSNAFIIVPQTGEIIPLLPPEPGVYSYFVEANDNREIPMYSDRIPVIINVISENESKKVLNRKKRAVRQTRTYKHFVESDGSVPGKVMFRLESVHPDEIFSVENESRWIDVDHNGDVKVNEPWDYEQLEREKTIDFWVLIRAPQQPGFLFSTINGNKIWLGHLETPINANRWPDTIISLHDQIWKPGDISQIQIVKEEDIHHITDSDLNKRQEDGIPLTFVDVIRQNDQNPGRNNQSSEQNVLFLEEFEPRQLEFQQNSEVNQQQTKKTEDNQQNFEKNSYQRIHPHSHDSVEVEYKNEDNKWSNNERNEQRDLNNLSVPASDKISENHATQVDSFDAKDQEIDDWKAKQDERENLSNTRKHSDEWVPEPGNLHSENQRQENELKSERPQQTFRGFQSDTRNRTKNWAADGGSSKTDQNRQSSLNRGNTKKPSDGWIAHESSLNVQNQALGYHWSPLENQQNVRKDWIDNQKEANGLIAKSDTSNTEGQQTEHGTKTVEYNQNIKQDQAPESQKHTGDWNHKEGNLQNQEIKLGWNSEENKIRRHDEYNGNSNANIQDDHNTNTHIDYSRQGWNADQNQQNSRHDWSAEKDTNIWFPFEGNLNKENQGSDYGRKENDNHQTIMEDNISINKHAESWASPKVNLNDERRENVNQRQNEQGRNDGFGRLNNENSWVEHNSDLNLNQFRSEWNADGNKFENQGSQHKPKFDQNKQDIRDHQIGVNDGSLGWVLQEDNSDGKNPELGQVWNTEPQIQDVRGDFKALDKQAEGRDSPNHLSFQQNKLGQNRNFAYNGGNVNENGIIGGRENWVPQEGNLNSENQGSQQVWNDERDQKSITEGNPAIGQHVGNRFPKENNLNVNNQRLGWNSEANQIPREDWRENKEGSFGIEGDFNTENKALNQNWNHQQNSQSTDESWRGTQRYIDGNFGFEGNLNSENKVLDHSWNADQNRQNNGEGWSGNFGSEGNLNTDNKVLDHRWNANQNTQNNEEGWTDTQKNIDGNFGFEGNLNPDNKVLDHRWNANQNTQNNEEGRTGTQKNIDGNFGFEGNLNTDNKVLDHRWNANQNRQNNEAGRSDTQKKIDGHFGFEGSLNTDNQVFDHKWNAEQNRQNTEEDRGEGFHPGRGNLNFENQDQIHGNNFQGPGNHAGLGNIPADGSNAAWPKGDTAPPSHFANQIPQGNYKGDDGQYHGNHDGTSENSIEGTPDVDYPIYRSLPITDFDCTKQEFSGYFADVATRCQVYHVCQADGRQDAFLCPIGTIFNQKLLTCDWWYNYDCSESPNYYSLNANLHKSSDAQGNFKGYNYPGAPTPLQQPYPRDQTIHSDTRQTNNLSGRDAGLATGNSHGDRSQEGGAIWNRQNNQVWTGPEQTWRHDSSGENHVNEQHVRNEYNSFTENTQRDIYADVVNPNFQRAGEAIGNHQISEMRNEHPENVYRIQQESIHDQPFNLGIRRIGLIYNSGESENDHSSKNINDRNSNIWKNSNKDAKNAADISAGSTENREEGPTPERISTEKRYEPFLGQPSKVVPVEGSYKDTKVPVSESRLPILEGEVIRIEHPFGTEALSAEIKGTQERFSILKVPQVNVQATGKDGVRRETDTKKDNDKTDVFIGSESKSNGNSKKYTLPSTENTKNRGSTKPTRKPSNSRKTYSYYR